MGAAWTNMTHVGNVEHMCGICGIVHTNADEPVDLDLLVRMRDTLTHRGPDDAGVHLSGPVGLGHRRLSIIDLSSDGHQPMSNEDGTVWITYNGEVYNFRELRPWLEARGHRFRSRTDTEVIIHLYEEYGEGAVGRLRGMFSLGIWDERKRQLLLARDRLGIKPLYYYCDARRIAFASELRALLIHPDVPRAIDPLAVDSYLTLLFVPGSQCIFRGISKLPPGSYALWRDGMLQVECYWDVRRPERARLDADPEELESLIAEAVRIRLVSDVPLGVFLSGGVDSSVVTALAAKVSPDPVRTFTLRFPGNRLDEGPYARAVSERYGTRHTEAELGAGDLSVDLVRRLGYHFDEPFADASAVPTFLLSETTRRDVTVALAGDGGDELFAGYEHHASYARLTAFQDRLPAFLRLGGAALSRAFLVPLGHVWPSARLRRIAKGLSWLDAPPLELVLRLLTYWGEEARLSLYGPRMRDVVAGAGAREWLAERTSAWPVANDLGTCLYANMRSSLADDMLVKVDRMSMYHGLEVRVPLLDHHLVEYTFTIEPGAMLRDGLGKLPLRRLAERLLPPQLVNRPKQGFHVPLDFLANREFSELIHDTLHADRIRAQGFFRPEAVSSIVAAFEDPKDRFAGLLSRYQVSHRLWSLLMFCLWYETYGAGLSSSASRRESRATGMPLSQA